MAMSSLNLKTPREAIYQSFKGQPGACPKCQGELLRSAQTYMVATRYGKKLGDTFVIGGDFGWFCTQCPVVVIDADRVGEMMSIGKPGWRVGPEFLVLGIVDLDAVPQNKRHLQLGAPGAPIPLIQFSNLGLSRDSQKEPAARHHRKAHK
jgi:hypothetical protein